MRNGPDFLCIGMQKAATHTLYDLLSADPRFWMPVVKEFHHFDATPARIAERHEATLNLLPVMESGDFALEFVNAARAASAWRALAETDREFLVRYQAYLKDGCQDSDYLELFSVCPEGLRTGDVTPGYSGLNRTKIEKVHALLPEVRILLIIRDPVARAWSHLNMTIRNSVPRRERIQRDPAETAAYMEHVASTVDVLPEFLKLDRLSAKGFASNIYRRWTSVYGENRVEVLSFEEVTQSPRQAINRVAERVGAASAGANGASAEPAAGGEGEATQNRKGKVPKLKMSDAQQETLVAFFRDEIIACEELFGAKAAGWAERYGIR